MSTALDITKAPTLLLAKDNKEVVRQFEDAYVIQTFKHYRNLKVPDHDIIKFFHKAQKTGADPVLDEIYLIPRKTKINGEYVVVGTIVFSYHFNEFKAQSSGQYGGISAITGPGEYFNPISREISKELKSTAQVVRDGKTFEFTAWWPEYVQTDYNGNVTSQWKSKPLLMLEKCAKAGALRAAFPEWLNGSYTQEELGAIEKDDAFIEAQFENKTRADANQVILDRIEEKEEAKKDEPEIKRLMDEIRGMFGVITHNVKDIQEKGKIMFKFTGVRAFDDLKLKTVNDLSKILDALVEEDKKLRTTKVNEDKPSFQLNLGGEK